MKKILLVFLLAIPFLGFGQQQFTNTDIVCWDSAGVVRSLVREVYKVNGIGQVVSFYDVQTNAAVTVSSGTISYCTDTTAVGGVQDYECLDTITQANSFVTNSVTSVHFDGTNYVSWDTLSPTCIDGYARGINSNSFELYTCGTWSNITSYGNGSWYAHSGTVFSQTAADTVEALSFDVHGGKVTFYVTRCIKYFPANAATIYSSNIDSLYTRNDTLFVVNNDASVDTIPPPDGVISGFSYNKLTGIATITRTVGGNLTTSDISDVTLSNVALTGAATSRIGIDTVANALYFNNSGTWEKLQGLPTAVGTVISPTETIPAGDSTATWQQVVDQMQDSITTAATLTVARNTSNKRADYICDGTADDVEIQAAITKLVSLGGGKLYIHEGTYNIASTITVNPAKITIEGGVNTVFQAVSPLSKILLIQNISFTGFGQNEEVQIEGIRFQGHTSNEVYAIDCVSKHLVTISNNTFVGDSLVAITSTALGWNNAHITGNNFNKVKRGIYFVAGAEDFEDISISNNDFSYCLFEAIYLDGGVNYRCRKVNITSNNIEESGYLTSRKSNAIYIKKATGIMIVGNAITQTYRNNAIYFDDCDYSSIVANNVDETGIGKLGGDIIYAISLTNDSQRNTVQSNTGAAHIDTLIKVDATSHRNYVTENTSTSYIYSDLGTENTFLNNRSVPNRLYQNTSLQLGVMTIGSRTTKGQLLVDTDVNPETPDGAAIYVQGERDREKIEIWSGGLATYQPLFVSKGFGGTAEVPTATLATKVLGGLAVTGHNGTSLLNTYQGRLDFSALNNWSGTDRSTLFKIQGTNSGTTNLREWLRISSGNMGLGTTTTTQRLNIDGAINAFSTGACFLNLHADTGNGPDEQINPYISFQQDGGALKAYVGYNYENAPSGAGTANNYFYIGNNYTADAHTVIVSGQGQRAFEAGDAQEIIFNAYTSATSKTGTTSHFVTQNSSGQFLTKSASDFRTDLGLATSYFAQGGNSFATTATLGTNDANSLAFETNNVTRATINSTGNIGIGTATISAKLDIVGTGTTNATTALEVNNSANNILTILDDRSATFNTGTGTGVSLAAGASAWASISARDTKENFEVLDYQSIYNNFRNVNIEKWNYKGSPNRNMGIMAEDFYEVFGKDLGVVHNHEKIETTDALGACMLLIKAQQEKIDELEARIKNLENK